MAQTLVEKPVLFYGIWRPRHSVDDHFLRTVSREFQQKVGARAVWRLTSEGLTLIVTQSQSGRQGQTAPIPVQNVKEVTVNRHNPLCLLTLFVDQQRRFNALVCGCDSPQDSAHVVSVFRRLQRSLSGQGYHLDLKQPHAVNWTLKTRRNGQGLMEEEDGRGGGGEGEGEGGGLNGHPDSLSSDGSMRSREGAPTFTTSTTTNNNNNDDGEGEVVVVRTEEEGLERESMEVEGRACYNVGVQAELGPDDDSDRGSTASEMSYQSLKDELISLSNEVRDIKLLLEQTTGISAEEFFRRQRDPNAPRLVPVKRLRSHDSQDGAAERRVNFSGEGEFGEEGDEEEEEDFDIRSVGMQTLERGSRRGKYMKRVRPGKATPSRFQPGGLRSRSVSSGSSQPSPSPSPVSPLSPYGAQRSVFTYDPRRDPKASLSRASVYSAGGTVVRPIEAVYHVPHASQAVRHRRRQVVVLPAQRASSVPRPRKVSTDSAHRPVSFVHTPLSPPPAPAVAAQNGGAHNGATHNGES